MGIFSAPKGNIYYGSGPSQMRSHPHLNRRRSTSKSPERPGEESQGSEEPVNPEIPVAEKAQSHETGVGDEGIAKEEDTDLKPKERKVAKTKNKERFDPQTSKNTRLNSMLYHTSQDSIDLYAKENDSSDLLGRLYYDDFDSDSMKSPAFSAATTPLMSPTGSVIGNDYFSSRTAGPVLTPSLLSPGASRVASSTTLPNLANQSFMEKKYERGISFDTSTNMERISLTLKAKHPKFKFRRNNKTYLTGYNDDKESLQAIKWLFDEMIINGDTIVILQVLDEKMHHEIDKKRSNKSLELIENLNVHNKKISIVYEIVIGKPQKLLKKAIDEYTPQMMAIGTHDDEKESKGFFSKTTMSKYFLQYALVPVIVVKSSYSHVEELKAPILDQDYFKNWLINIDISDTYLKDKEKKAMKKKIGKSPLSSRSSSLLNLTSLNEERGRQRTTSGTAEDHNKFKFHISPSRSRSSSRSLSHNDTGSAPEHRSDSRSSARKSFSKLFHHH